MYSEKNFYKFGSELYMSKPLFKKKEEKQQNKENRSAMIGVCRCCWKGEFRL